MCRITRDQLTRVTVAHVIGQVEFLGRAKNGVALYRLQTCTLVNERIKWYVRVAFESSCKAIL
jgi:hypothetical protein